mmetsp:Transcript_15277/g.49942  ORF Transcript_15277/g.49942 Transcript_15277/m.49942 type:complete len:115 (+) Transcript_15277:190-534(+)
MNAGPVEIAFDVAEGTSSPRRVVVDLRFDAQAAVRLGPCVATFRELFGPWFRAARPFFPSAPSSSSRSQEEPTTPKKRVLLLRCPRLETVVLPPARVVLVRGPPGWETTTTNWT